MRINFPFSQNLFITKVPFHHSRSPLHIVRPFFFLCTRTMLVLYFACASCQGGSRLYLCLDGNNASCSAVAINQKVMWSKFIRRYILGFRSFFFRLWMRHTRYVIALDLNVLHLFSQWYFVSLCVDISFIYKCQNTILNRPHSI